MRTTVDLPDDLLQAAQERAAAEGLHLREYIERTLRVALAESMSRGAGRVTFPLHRSSKPGALTENLVRAAEEASSRGGFHPCPFSVTVNLLLALVTDRHEHHAIAAQWIENMQSGEVVVCRVVQTGLLRLLNNPSVMGDEALEADDCWPLWHRLLEDARVLFVASEPAGLDTIFETFTSGRGFTPKLWTDAYLAGYARTGGLTLVTFDSGFSSFPGLACEVLSGTHKGE